MLLTLVAIVSAITFIAMSPKLVIFIKKSKALVEIRMSLGSGLQDFHPSSALSFWSWVGGAYGTNLRRVMMTIWEAPRFPVLGNGSWAE